MAEVVVGPGARVHLLVPLRDPDDPWGHWQYSPGSGRLSAGASGSLRCCGDASQPPSHSSPTQTPHVAGAFCPLHPQATNQTADPVLSSNAATTLLLEQNHHPRCTPRLSPPGSFWHQALWSPMLPPNPGHLLPLPWSSSCGPRLSHLQSHPRSGTLFPDPLLLVILLPHKAFPQGGVL